MSWGLFGQIAAALIPLLLAVLGWALHERSERGKELRQKHIQQQPLLNRVAVRLFELNDAVHFLQADEWDQAYQGYQSIPPQEDLERLADEVSAVSASASYEARRLFRTLADFQETVNSLGSIGDARAAEILERADTGESTEWVRMNQEFHAWRDKLAEVADQLAALARALAPHADPETRKQLQLMAAGELPLDTEARALPTLTEQTLPESMTPVSPSPLADLDRDLIRRFLDSLPYEGAIRFIDQFNMAGFAFPPEHLDELFAFHSHWNDAEHEFLDLELEDARKALWAKIDQYLESIAINTFATKTGLQTVPPEWEYKQNERFRSVVKELHDLAAEVVSLHQDLVRLARRKSSAVVGDPES